VCVVVHALSGFAFVAAVRGAPPFGAEAGTMSRYAFVLLRCQPRRLHHGDWVVRAMQRGDRKVVVLVPTDDAQGECELHGPIPWEAIGREVALHVDGGQAGEPFRESVWSDARFEDATLMVLPVPRSVLERVAARQGELFGGES
jgi:hypothetical protein